MPSPTTTLQELRRAVCKELRMPFFRRVGNSSTVDAGSTTTKIIDASLSQRDKYWNAGFVYYISTQTTSVINAFNANNHELRLEKSVGATPTPGDAYEIQSIWSADEVHEAINRAIKTSRQSFFSPTIDENTHCLVEDVLEYDISGFTTLPWILTKIYMEYPINGIYFVSTAGGASTITVPADIPITEVDNTWKISIYNFTGKGQVRSVTGVAGQVVTVDTPWDTVPDATSKCLLINPIKSSWYPVHNFHQDAIEYPQFFRMTRKNPDYYGGRLRFEFLGLSQELTTEASTTIVPEEYIVNKACSILHGQVLNGTKADKESHYAEFKRYQEEADAFLIRNAPHAPSIHIKHPDAHIDSLYRERDDPLNWGF